MSNTNTTYDEMYNNLTKDYLTEIAKLFADYYETWFKGAWQGHFGKIRPYYQQIHLLNKKQAKDLQKFEDNNHLVLEFSAQTSVLPIPQAYYLRVANNMPSIKEQLDANNQRSPMDDFVNPRFVFTVHHAQKHTELFSFGIYDIRQDQNSGQLYYTSKETEKDFMANAFMSFADTKIQYKRKYVMNVLQAIRNQLEKEVVKIQKQQEKERKKRMRTMN